MSKSNQNRLDELEQRLTELEQQRSPQITQADVDAYLDKLPVSRRQLLGAVAAGTISLPLLYADIARAQQGDDGDPYACVWLGHQDANGFRLDDALQIETDAIIVRQGHGLLDFPNHHTNYADGLSNEEITRFTLATGDKLQVWRLEAALKGGGSNANVTVDVRDATNGTTLASVDAGSRDSGSDDPLGTSGDGATIILRISNSSGSAQDIAITGHTTVVSA